MAVKQVVLESSSLRWVGYDPARQVLEVEFSGGARYRYEQVPVEVVAQLAAAESAGTFFNQVFKARGFPYRRLG